MHMRTYYATLLLCLFGMTLTANTNPPAYTWEYINAYSHIAIREMNRSGIPASITLAQGIHESSWGKGTLSTNSNNHFGIKCKKEWRGPTFYIEDDDYVNGKLTKSCFRSYGTVEESYIDHTDFLMQNIRYQRLFKLATNDYVGWAQGLKACGYATDPNYATKLIKTIKEYQLDEYDNINALEETPMIAAASPPQYEQPVVAPSIPSVAPAIEYTASLAPDMESPQAYVLPDNYQRNSSRADIAEVIDYTIMSAPQNNVTTEEEDPMAHTPAVEMAPLSTNQYVETTTVEEVATINQTAPQSAPTFSAPSYQIQPRPVEAPAIAQSTIVENPVISNSTMINRVQEDLIKSSVGTQHTQVQLSRKPRGENVSLR